jgi:hypothetical protein
MHRRSPAHAIALLLVACLLALACAWGCAPGFAAAEADPQPNATPGAPTPDEDWTQSERGKALIARADEVLAQVERVRGLSTTRPVHKGLMRRDQLMDVLLAKLQEEHSDEEIAHEGLALKALGLIPEDMDYKAFMLSLLVEQIAGFYDDNTQSLYIMEGQTQETMDQVFSHELYHAVQDQQFGISKIRDEVAKKNADMMQARTALIEGDAVGVMLDYDLQPRGQTFSGIPGFSTIIRLSVAMMVGGGSDTFSQAPLALREALLFPYIAGVSFVYEVKRAGGWEAVNKLYGALPASTEQILHPDRYFAGDQAKAVTFEGGLGDVVYDDVMGEQGWRVYFQHHASGDAEAIKAGLDAAEGWGGDRLKVAKVEGGLVVVSLSAWDSEADAGQFVEAMTQVAQARWGVKATPPPAAGVTALEGGARRVWLERRGDRVLYIDADGKWPVDRLRDSAGQVWGSVEVR